MRLQHDFGTAVFLAIEQIVRLWSFTVQIGYVQPKRNPMILGKRNELGRELRSDH